MWRSKSADKKSANNEDRLHNQNGEIIFKKWRHLTFVLYFNDQLDCTLALGVIDATIFCYLTKRINKWERDSPKIIKPYSFDMMSFIGAPSGLIWYKKIVVLISVLFHFDHDCKHFYCIFAHWHDDCLSFLFALFKHKFLVFIFLQNIFLFFTNFCKSFLQQRPRHWSLQFGHFNLENKRGRTKKKKKKNTKKIGEKTERHFFFFLLWLGCN